MQEFTEEFKAIKKALDKCWGGRASKNDELSRLQKERKKILCDIALGLTPPSKKKILNSKIMQLKQDIEDSGIAISELELKQTLMKRSGVHIQEKVEVEE